MDEIHNCQESITNSLTLENEKYLQLERGHEIDHMIIRTREYQEKIIDIKRNMLVIKDKVNKLKKKGFKLLEDKNREDLEIQRSKERREMLERHLEPVVNTR